MSSINELSIQGIRSFGHKKSDSQSIQFFRPLTLITGQNGAGKTTVIECLRYMTTGETPSLTAFIHDPRLAQKTEVRAHVELRFKDVTEKAVVVKRCHSATKKSEEETIHCRAVECNITRENRSRSPKVAELNQQMVKLLGDVSRPVLNSVIFCHQEDANWPLGTGKDLKDKFDEIFAAVRYRKALDNIHQIRKDQDRAITEYKTKEGFYKQNKEKAKQLDGDLQGKKAQLSAAKEAVTRINKDLEPIDKRIRNINAELEEVGERNQELKNLQFQKKELVKSRKVLEKGLKVYKGSEEELCRMSRNHHNIMTKKQKTLKQEEKNLAKMRQVVGRIEDNKSDLLEQRGRLEQEKKQHKATESKRNKKIKQVAKEHNIAGYDDIHVGDNKKIKDFMEDLEDKTMEQQQEVADCKQKYEEQQTTVENKLQALRDEQNNLLGMITRKTESMKENETELKSIADDLNEMDNTEPEFQDSKKKEKNAVQATTDMGELKKEIQQLQADKKKKDTSMDKLIQEMSTLSIAQLTNAQMKMLQKEKKAKEDQIKQISGKRKEEVIQLVGHIFSVGKMSDKLSNFIEGKYSAIHDTQKELDQAIGDMASLKARKVIYMEELEKLEDQLKTGQEALSEVLDEGEDLDESMEKLHQSIINLASEKGALTGSTPLVERCIATLEEQVVTGTCPDCHAEFDTQLDVDGLVQELHDQLRPLPSKLQEKERDLVQQRKALDELINLKPTKDMVNRLSNDEIPTLESELATIDTSIANLQENTSKLKSKLSTLQKEERTAIKMQPDIWQMDRCQEDLNELKRKITAQSLQLSGKDANRNMQQIISEMKDLRLIQDTVSQELEMKHQQVEEQTESVHQKLRLTIMAQQQKKLQEQQVALKQEIKAAKGQLQPVKKRLMQKELEKNYNQQQKEAEVEALQSQVVKLEGRRNEITSLTEEMEGYVKSGNELETCQQTIAAEQQKLDVKKLELETLTNTIDQTKEELANQETRKREVADNLQLRKKQREEQDIDGQIASVKEQLAKYDTASLQNENSQLWQKHKELTTDRDHAAGRQPILDGDVKKLKKELNEDMYKYAERNYQDLTVKLQTTQKANKDLKIFYDALDKAIIQYHKQQMGKINRIIRDLWQKTYKGDDIDYIEICSEDTVTGAIKARRTYNYRVVMVKGETSLDMRGRCSAGQKVLASLIIRMALAETFCLNCGILALDEPTTNLDSENKKSLADVLLNIIESRENQQNFQLIVITHDEEFVDLLGRSNYTDYFYKITKNDEHKSVVEKHRIESL
ncbi:DNA repair protein RAD50.L-like [Amphiura filiformis]|uniref:DNA repair protein RAD50.L-like n=1 Tax=Amphiura filiformis TaxID=82378 RepID=UPI003B221798